MAQTARTKANQPPLEALHPELLKCLRIHDTLGEILHHPLVIGVPYASSFNAHYNNQYKQTLQRLREAQHTMKWDSYVFIHERPYRLVAFLEVADKLSDCAYWELVGEVWSDSDNIYEHKADWERILASTRLERDSIMGEKDKRAFDKLPSSIDIYRGHSHKIVGLSWTLDRDKAVWFAQRFNKRERYLSSMTITKDKCIAYFGGRNEQEIVIHPTSATNNTIKTESVT